MPYEEIEKRSSEPGIFWSQYVEPTRVEFSWQLLALCCSHLWQCQTVYMVYVLEAVCGSSEECLWLMLRDTTTISTEKRISPLASGDYHWILTHHNRFSYSSHPAKRVVFHPRDVLCMFISNGLTSLKWSPAWPTPRLKLSRVQMSINPNSVSVISTLRK